MVAPLREHARAERVAQREPQRIERMQQGERPAGKIAPQAAGGRCERSGCSMRSMRNARGSRLRSRTDDRFVARRSLGGEIAAGVCQPKFRIFSEVQN
jgi:hypothetical protein